MEELSAASLWATQEFGDAALGSKRRTDRVVLSAALAAARPGPTVAKTFGRTAAAQGAFRFVQNELISVEALAAAPHRAAARRCEAYSEVIVPIDGTSARVKDPRDLRGLGPLSSHTDKARGIQYMHAIAVAPTGENLGVLARESWLRPFVESEAPPVRRKSARKMKRRHCSAQGRRHRRASATRDKQSRPRVKNSKPLEERESNRWVTMLQSADAVMKAHAPKCTPWYQLDRGGDCWMVIQHAVAKKLTLTVRANQNRVLEEAGTYLFSTIRGSIPIGEITVQVPKRPKRKARNATLILRALRVTIPLPVTRKKRKPCEIVIVQAIEKDLPVDGSERIEWLLLTTREVHTAADAAEVVHAYTRRWRIEDFHRAWKEGACGIESTRLRAYDHILRWAILMASVATRIENIKMLSRTSPDLPATECYTQDEIDAAILLRSRHRKLAYEPGQVPPLGEVTRWIADLAGYMGSKNSPPPGSTILRRGFEQVATAAQVLAIQRERASQPPSGRSGQ
jgi:hypothetical protein